MQPYRFVTTMAREGQGPGGQHLCQHDGCDEPAESQHRRHATDAEYAEIPEGLVPVDGVCHMAVFTCGDHELDPICGPQDHGPDPIEQPDPLAAACQKCGARPGTDCVKPNGQPRRVVHEIRTTTPPVFITRCDHVHRADCGGIDTCDCGPDDPAPIRTPGAADLKS